jgi:competence protein ComEC
MPGEEQGIPRRPRYQPLVVVATALMGGIALDRWAALDFAWIGVASLLAMGGWGLAWRRERHRTGCIYLFAVVVCAGAGWHHVRWRYFDADDISTFAREEYAPAVLEGVAREAPRRVAAPPFDPMNAIPRGERSRLELDVTSIRDGDAWRSVTGRALLAVDGELTDVEGGDRLRVIGAFATPSPPLNPGGFSYADYLRADRIRTVVFAEHRAAITRLAPASRYNPRRWLGRVRVLGEQDLGRYLSPRSASLAAALLLNAREQMETARTEAFLETGTIHHLAISGTHVGILAATLFFVLRLGLLPRRLALGLIVGIVTLYGLVTGGDAPVLRSVVLVAIVCLALHLGRRPLGFNSLGAAAICVLIWNPSELFDVGAQLSFLSVAVLIHMARHWIDDGPTDPLERLIASTRPWPIRASRWLGRMLWRITAISLAVWLVTLPLIMARFHLVSPVAVALNPLVWAPVAVALLSGFFTLVVGPWIPPLGAAMGWVCDRSLALTEFAVNGLNSLPGGHTYVPGPSNWWLAGFYAGCVAIGMFPTIITWRRRSALLSAWVIVGLLPALWEADDTAALHCHFLSVGHGCAGDVCCMTRVSWAYRARRQERSPRRCGFTA